MTVTDDGKWQAVPWRTYMAFLRTHPRRQKLQRARFDQGDGRGPMWYIFDGGTFEADDRPAASTTAHMVALRVIWLERDGGDGRMRYWIPATSPADSIVKV